MRKPPARANRPQHVALIMDGNRRWARRHRRSHEAAYRAGMEATRRLIAHAAGRKIPALTLFAFSNENQQRPKRQVDLLLRLFSEALGAHVDELLEQGVHVRFIGELDGAAPKLQAQMRDIEARAPRRSSMTVCVAIHYGGRQDLLRAMARCQARQAPLTEAAVSAALDTSPMPDPDLLIRTGGERRISNFLLWQLAYTELYFTDCLWPDFDAHEFDRALEWFAGRDRRFGVSAG